MMDKEALLRMRAAQRAQGGPLTGLDALAAAGTKPQPPQPKSATMQLPNGEYFQAPVVLAYAFDNPALQQITQFVANADWFRQLYNNIQRLHQRNALHTKKNEHISDWSLKDMCRHLRDEVTELYESDGTSIAEAADILNVLYCIVVRNGWYLEDLHRQAQLKLESRFVWDDELSKQTIRLMQETGELAEPPLDVKMGSEEAQEPTRADGT